MKPTIVKRGFHISSGLEDEDEDRSEVLKKAAEFKKQEDAKFKKQEESLDRANEDSFPASDPSSYGDNFN